MGKLAITRGPNAAQNRFQWRSMEKKKRMDCCSIESEMGTLGPEVAKFTERFCNYLV